MAAQSSSRPDSLFGRAIREGFFAGLLALGLFCLIIGFKTDQNINNELVLQQRWGALAVIVVLAAIGRFLFVAFTQPWLEARKLAKSKQPAVAVFSISVTWPSMQWALIPTLCCHPISACPSGCCCR